MPQCRLAITDVGMVFKRLFSSPVEALKHVSLTVAAGEVVGLLGPNGAGKSTLMRIACGLILPRQGQARVEGRRPDTPEVRRSIGAVLESERWMIWQLSGRENLNYFAALRGMTDRRARLRRVDECLEIVDLEGAAKRAVGEYSRGMKQRLALAGALLTDPTLLLLDEPTLGLDLEGQALIRQLLSRFAAEGRGVLLATHQLELAARYTQRIAFLRKGELVADEPVSVLIGRYAPSEFEVAVTGELTAPDRMTLTCEHGCRVEPDGDTWLIRCPAALAADPYPLLAWLGARGLTLVRAGLASPDLEEVYQRIMVEAGTCSGGPSARPSCDAAG